MRQPTNGPSQSSQRSRIFRPSICATSSARWLAPIYDYVLHERLARTLDAVLDGNDLTAIALDAGFASHSHFTARFRRFFGCTPTALRRIGPAGHAAKLRKIMTARRRQLA